MTPAGDLGLTRRCADGLVRAQESREERREGKGRSEIQKGILDDRKAVRGEMEEMPFVQAAILNSPPDSQFPESGGRVLDTPSPGPPLPATHTRSRAVGTLRGDTGEETCYR